MDYSKKPLAASLNQLAINRAAEAIDQLGKALPCTVVSVPASGFATINFEVDAGPITLPKVTVPVLMAKYLRIPLQPGDIGVCIPADASLAGLTGLGSGVATLTPQANLATLMFCPLGSKAWTAVNLQATVITDATGKSIVSVEPSGVYVTAETAITGSLDVSGNVTIGNGASGTFTSVEGLTIVIQDGVCTVIN